MKPKVTIVDYGVGNMYSVGGAIEHCGAEPVMSRRPEEVDRAERLILPGVGAFADSMADMRDSGLIEPVRRFVENGGPLLGICLGMQMLFDASEEFGLHKGLGLIPGAVTAIPDTGADGRPHRIPHVGWNELVAPNGGDWTGTILEGVAPGTSAYFAHSFMASPTWPTHRLAECDYHGRAVSAVVHSGNVFGCQFHPELSGKVGLRILRNFIERS